MGTFQRFDGALLTFDATTTEEITEDAIVTEHPVQNGGFVSDHRKDKPVELTIEGIVSESPLQGQQGLEEILGGDLAGNRGVLAKRFFNLGRNETFAYISSRFGRIERLALQSTKTSIPGSASTEFSLTFKRISFAQAETVDVPREFIPPPSAEPLKQCSDQATSDMTDIGNSDQGLTSIAQSGDLAIGDFGKDLVSGSVETLANLF